MAKVEVKIDWEAARKLRNSEEMQDILLEKAQAIADSASSKSGKEYIADVQPGVNRAHAQAKTGSWAAVQAESKHNYLLKSLSAGR